MRGAGRHRDLLALEPLGQRIFYCRIPLRHETRRRAVVGISEIDVGAHRPRRRDGCDGSIPLIAVERRNKRFEAAHLDCAGELELLAQHARQIDVEALRIPVRPGVIERRVVGLGKEPDDTDARQIGLFRPTATNVSNTRVRSAGPFFSHGM